MTLDLEKLSTEIKDLNDNCPVHVRAGDLRELVGRCETLREEIQRLNVVIRKVASGSLEAVQLIDRAISEDK
jgi:hypothetical protein